MWYRSENNYYENTLYDIALNIEDGQYKTKTILISAPSPRRKTVGDWRYRRSRDERRGAAPTDATGPGRGEATAGGSGRTVRVDGVCLCPSDAMDASPPPLTTPNTPPATSRSAPPPPTPPPPHSTSASVAAEAPRSISERARWSLSARAFAAAASARAAASAARVGSSASRGCRGVRRVDTSSAALVGELGGCGVEARAQVRHLASEGVYLPGEASGESPPEWERPEPELRRAR